MPKNNPVIIIPETIADEISSYKDDHPRKKAFNKFLEQLKTSQLSNGANLEQLMGKQVLSVRLEGKARILIAPQKINDKFAWILLETLWEHEYDDARFLKKGVLNNFLRKHQQCIIEMVSTTEEGEVAELIPPKTNQTEEKPLAELTSNMPTDDDAGEDINISEICIYNKCVISPTIAQNECLSELTKRLKVGRFGALVSGAPGTGKTLLAYQVIVALIEEDPAAKICYVADSAHLRSMLQAQWQQSPTYDEAHEDAVQFYDYKKLMCATNPDWLSELEPVDDKDLETFFAKKQKQKKRRAAATRASIDFEQFRQECDVMASLETLEDYHAIGSSHTLFPGEDNAVLREQLWEIYQVYDKKLTDSKQYHPKLKSINSSQIKPSKEHIIIIDEACDLSRVELHNLIQLGFKIIFLGDNNQDLAHTSHTIEFLSQEIAREFPHPHHYITSLDASFRCSQNITAAASTLLALKRKVTAHGSTLVNTDLRSAIDSAGNVEHISNGNSDKLAALSSSANTAIICHAKDKDNVRKKLGTDLVFTVEEIKGLGFHTVILWELIPIKQAKKLNELFDKGKVQREDISADDKQLITVLNNLYTALTRAEMQIILKQSSKNPAITRLLDHITKGGELTQAIDEISDEPSTIYDWLDMADKIYREKGLNAQSNGIYETQAQKLINAGDTEQTNDIYRRQINILYEIGKTEEAKAIEEAHALVDNTIDSTDAEEKVTPPSSPQHQQLMGVGKTKHTPDSTGPFFDKTAAEKVEAEKMIVEEAETIEGDRLTHYQLTFKSPNTGTGKRNKRGSKKVSVTFNIDLDETQVNGILACTDSEDIENITAQHLAAMLLTKPGTSKSKKGKEVTLPINIYNDLINRIIKTQPQAVLQLAKKLENEITKAPEKLQASILLKLLQSKEAQSCVYTYLSSTLTSLAAINKVVCLWFCVSLSKVYLEKEEFYSNSCFINLIELAKDEDRVRKTLFSQLNTAVLSKVIIHNHLALPKLIALAETHSGAIKIISDSLDCTVLNTALHYGRCDATIIDFLKDYPSAIPDSFLALLMDKRAGSGFLLDNITNPDTLKTIAELAKIRPDICDHFLKGYVDSLRKGRHFYITLQYATKHSAAAFSLLITIASSNTAMKRAILTAISEQSSKGPTVFHYLITYNPQLFIPLVTLALDDPEYQPLLSHAFNCTLTTKDCTHHNPLSYLTYEAPETMCELIQLSVNKPFLRKLIRTAFMIDIKQYETSELPENLTILTLSTMHEYKCFALFTDWAYNDPTFCEIFVTKLEQSLLNKSISLYNLVSSNDEIFPVLISLADKNPTLRDLLARNINKEESKKWNPMHVMAQRSHTSYEAILKAATKHLEIYSALLKAMSQKTEDEGVTPLHLSTKYSPKILEKFVEYTLIYKDPDAIDKLMDILLIGNINNLSVLGEYIFRGHTQLFELAKYYPKLQQLIARSLSVQDTSQKMSSILTIIAIANQNLMPTLVEMCDTNPDVKASLLKALPLFSLQLTGMPRRETGLQSIAFYTTGVLPKIIKLLIEDIRSSSETRDSSINTLTRFITADTIYGKKGMHFILMSDKTLRLYKLITDTAKYFPELEAAIKEELDKKDEHGQSPADIIQRTASYRNIVRIFNKPPCTNSKVDSAATGGLTTSELVITSQ